MEGMWWGREEEGGKDGRGGSGVAFGTGEGARGANVGEVGRHNVEKGIDVAYSRYSFRGIAHFYTKLLIAWTHSLPENHLIHSVASASAPASRTHQLFLCFRFRTQRPYPSSHYHLYNKPNDPRRDDDSGVVKRD